MSIAITLYALVSAAVLGWLIHKHLTARCWVDKVPLHIFALLPLLWLPTLLAAAALLTVAITANAWRNWRQP